MNGKKIPVFLSGKILTKEMMQSLTEFAIADSELLYQNYSDGVLCGCELTTTLEDITIHPGIVIRGGKAYYILQEIVVPYEKTNESMILKVRFEDVVTTDNYVEEGIDIVLEPEAMLKADEIELCRFKLQIGAKLRTQYKNFADMDTEYDTVHYTYAKWAARQMSSLSPVILQMFYNEAVLQENLDEKYMAFLLKIAGLKQETMNRQELILFVCHILQKPYKEMDNEAIYADLKAIMSMIKGGSGPARRRPMMERRMIVDL